MEISETANCRQVCHFLDLFPVNLGSFHLKANGLSFFPQEQGGLTKNFINTAFLTFKV